MEQMTYDARDFLRSVREARIEKRRCEHRLAELRAQCERTTAAYSAVPGGGGDTHKDALLIAAKDSTGEIKKVLETLKICNRMEYV